MNTGRHGTFCIPSGAHSAGQNVTSGQKYKYFMQGHIYAPWIYTIVHQHSLNQSITDLYWLEPLFTSTYFFLICPQESPLRSHVRNSCQQSKQAESTGPKEHKAGWHTTMAHSGESPVTMCIPHFGKVHWHALDRKQGLGGGWAEVFSAVVRVPQMEYIYLYLHISGVQALVRNYPKERFKADRMKVKEGSVHFHT